MKNQNNITKQFETIIGIDLGDIQHAICVTDNHGSIIEEKSIVNRREILEELAEQYPGALIAMEVGSHSPWISRLLAAHGADVVVANARKLRAIYTNDRKCDQLDARMLAKLVRVDPELLSPIQHGSEEAQRDFVSIKLRYTLVRQRVNVISSIRFTLKSLGIRLPAPSTPAFVKAARRYLEANDHLEYLATIEPCLKVIDELGAQIKELDKKIETAINEKYQHAQRLQQVAGVGPITALSFVLAVEDPGRFEDPRDVGAYFGLVPKRDQSGDADKQLPISKAGNKQVRQLLVQCAQYILGHHGPDSDLRWYGLRLAARGGRAAKRKAVVAVARKLSVLLLIMWRRDSDYEPLKNATADQKAPEPTGGELTEAA
jgi:transposase